MYQPLRRQFDQHVLACGRGCGTLAIRQSWRRERSGSVTYRLTVVDWVTHTRRMCFDVRAAGHGAQDQHTCSLVSYRNFHRMQLEFIQKTCMHARGRCPYIPVGAALRTHVTHHVGPHCPSGVFWGSDFVALSEVQGGHRRWP